MDLRLNSAAALEPQMTLGRHAAGEPRGHAAAGSALQAAAAARAIVSGAAVLYARFILVTITCGVTTYGVYQMLQVVRFASMTLLQGLMIFFFAVSLGWIAFAAGSVLAGASKRRDPNPPPRRVRTGSRAVPFAHGARDAHLQRRPAAHHRGAASHGRSAARTSAPTAVSRS